MGQATHDRLVGNACEGCGVWHREGDVVSLGTANPPESLNTVREYDPKEHRDLGMHIYCKQCTNFPEELNL